jgi:hypothetical protein
VGVAVFARKVVGACDLLVHDGTAVGVSVFATLDGLSVEGLSVASDGVGLGEFLVAVGATVCRREVGIVVGLTLSGRGVGDRTGERVTSVGS